MKEVSVNKLVLRFAPLALAVSCSLSLLSGCGSDSSDSIVGSTDASISGTIVAAPVNGANVSVEDASGNVVAEPVTTNDAGLYTLSVPNDSLGQDLIVKSMGGTFTDEASGDKDVPAGEMFAYVAANSISNGSSISATPGSTIIANLVMNHGKTRAEAEAVFANAFGYTPDMSVSPVDATDPAAVDASEASRLAGLRAAAFSQLAKDLGADDQFEMFAALAQDLSDKTLNGVGIDNAGTPVPVNLTIQGSISPLVIDIQNRFATALLNFHNNGLMGDTFGNDQTGLTSAQIGTVPFAKVALTDNSYRIEYQHMPGMMSAMEGKTTFKLHITDLAGNGIPNLTPTLMPKMHMETMAHSSPVTAVTDDGANGLYTATVYYLMPSMMGYWDLKVDLDGIMMTTTDIAHFYPSVMADATAKVKMFGVGDLTGDLLVDADDLAAGADVIKNMDGTFSARTYIIFKEELSSNPGSYGLSVFIAAKEHMMSFPAVLEPGSLYLDMMQMLAPLDVSSVTVEMSDDAGSSWKTAVSNGLNGIWTANGLTLTAGEVNQVMIRMNVNGEAKVANGTDEFQTFFVTP